MADVLFIHPSGHLNDLVVPAGAITCMNAVAASKLGRYSFEVSDEEIQRARVICIDVHWALALGGFGELVAHVRRLAPAVPIVVGGITAGHFPGDLLDEYAVDWVLQGDSEASFACLVEALLAGRDPGALPNVHGRGRQAPRARMTSEALDVTDPLTADWFPTYQEVSAWDAVAFPPGRTLSVARGCPLRCPECYGSYASTFGSGYLLRSPEGTARLLRRAQDLGLRNLRLFVAKPNPAQLAAICSALARAGPFELTSAVGLYLCRAPSEEDLDHLEAAFRTPLVLSFVPPEEHVPPLPAERLAEERAAWARVAARALRSRVLRLDGWAARTRDVGRLRAELTAEPSDRVTVSYGAVWSVTRPNDAGEKLSLPVVRGAVRELWTFYAARLLSPSLSRLLAPYQNLDEVDPGVDDPPVPEPPFTGWQRTIAEAWRRHHLALLPGIEFELAELRGPPEVSRRPAGPARRPPRPGEPASTSGDLRTARDAVLTGRRHAGKASRDHRGVELAFELSEPGAELAFVPRGEGEPWAPWAQALARDGLVVVRTPPGARRVVVHLRVQDARVWVLDASGEPLARGVATLGYFDTAAATRSGPRVPLAPARRRTTVG
ncbi:MAG: hypothetical protein IT376_22330 [Polyangiaceae bacterium]|nr:hypothetical protein [Polyangiaceae bacterium]